MAKTIEVRAHVHVMGLRRGEVGEVADTPAVRALIDNGRLERVGKRRRSSTSVAEEAPEATAEEAPADEG